MRLIKPMSYLSPSYPPPKISEIIESLPESVGSFSPALRHVEEVISRSYCTVDMVAEAVQTDVDLAARLMRYANSSDIAFAHQITSLAQAVSVIGTHQVTELIRVSQIIKCFSEIDVAEIEMVHFWQHSIACGIATREIGLLRKLPGRDQFFLAGLLHDIGRLIILSQMPEFAGKIFERYKKNNALGLASLTLREAEVEVLGYDHQTIGQVALAKWGFNATITHAVGYHHHPTMAVTGHLAAAAVHVADHLVSAMKIGCSGETFIPQLKPQAWQLVGLEVEDVGPLVLKIDRSFKEIQDLVLAPVRNNVKSEPCDRLSLCR